MEAEQVDVVVVGTGWNGLICAKTYLELAPDANLILVEQGASFGGVWSKEKIYPGLFAQINIRQFEYSFYPMRREGLSDDGYISGDTIHTYLTEFATSYNLAQRTRFRTTVRSVSRLPGRGWRLELEEEAKRPLECGKLIYASGATSHAVVPPWPRDNFDLPMSHSQQTGTSLQHFDTIHRATVVGGAKSAFDTVFILLRAGKKVDWVIRPDASGSGPVALMPPMLFGFVNSTDVIGTRFMAMLGASIMSTGGTGYQLIHKTRLGRFLCKNFWKIVNMIAAGHAGYSRSSNARKLEPLPHGDGIFWANAGLGSASVPNFWKVFHAGDCTVHRAEIESFKDSTVNLSTGARLQTDHVILCTGFDKSYQPFDDKLQRECGLAPSGDSIDLDKWTQLEARAEGLVIEKLPVLGNPPLLDGQFNHGPNTSHGPSRHYRRLIVPALAAQGDRSIIFPGFIHSIYTPLVSEVQALWGVSFLLGLHDPPSLAEMEQEVAEWNVWSRRRYPTQGRKHAYAIFDFIPYIDTLLKDLNINTRRRSNFLAHLFLPNYPRLYRGLVDEFRRSREPKRQNIPQWPDRSPNVKPFFLGATLIFVAFNVFFWLC